MKPSSKPNVVAVLDTLAECKVLNDVFDDPDFALNKRNTHANEPPEDWLRTRFIKQTMHLPEFDAYATEATFNADPEFDVQRRDAYYVLKAAERVIEERNHAVRAFNRVTGRTKAAKGMIRFLTSRED